MRLKTTYLDCTFPFPQFSLGVLDGDIDFATDDADAETLIRDSGQLDHARRTPYVGDG